jgi:tyrosyl-tRNA synthetase
MAPDPLTMLRSGAAEIHPAGGLEEVLERGRPLRVKLGLDPTAPSVTLGRAVVLRKLRQFQDAGHTAVLIVGDLTARVGDPSGKSETRPQLTKEQVDGYAERLLGGIRKVLSDDNLEIRYNSDWLESMAIDDILKLTASYTVARMLERDDFAKRYTAGKPISVMEFLYPLLQGYDSVAVGADIELGGTDQLFNLLVGRELQRDRGLEPQIIVTMPLLEGLDGVQKMSQSLGNYVGIDEPPEEQFGKLMSIPDGLIPRYMRLCTSLEPPVVDSVEKGLADGSAHPNDEKRRMAREIVDLYHGAGAGADAEGRFDLVFREHLIPTDVPTAAIPDDALRDGRVWLPRLLLSVGMAASNGEARRSIEQGAVRIDGEVVTDPGAEYEPDDLRGRVLQSGRRRFIRLA